MPTHFVYECGTSHVGPAPQRRPPGRPAAAGLPQLCRQSADRTHGPGRGAARTLKPIKEGEIECVFQR
jgi:hypothetical protein